MIEIFNTRTSAYHVRVVNPEKFRLKGMYMVKLRFLPYPKLLRNSD